MYDFDVCVAKECPQMAIYFCPHAHFIYAGKPAPDLSWFIDSTPVSGSVIRTHIGDTIVRNQLNLTVSRNLLNKTLSCKAHNSYFSISKSITLEMNRE